MQIDKPESIQYYRKQWQLKQRVKLLDLLAGPKGIQCSSCGFNDIRALQIDHLNGNGNKEIKTFKGNIYRMYKAYLKNPEQAKKSLQILCANCNWVKRFEKQENKNQIVYL